MDKRMGRNFLYSSRLTRSTRNDASSMLFYAARQCLPGAPGPLKFLCVAASLWCAAPANAKPQASYGARGRLVSKNEKILLDEPQQTVPPPMESSDTLNADFKARREERKSKEQGKTELPGERLKKKEEKSKNVKIVDEILADKPIVMQLAASLVVPSITTYGTQRKNYTAEPTAHVHLYLRPGGSKLNENIQLWTGFRVAPFGGSATYKNVSGRYGFTYFGPMIGMGSLSGAPRSISKELSESADGPGAFHRTGFFFMGGIAAQSREAGLDKGVNPPAGELNKKGVAYDAPGLWLEYSIVSMDYNALSYNYTVGVQTGEAKVFVYVGIGTGFWY